MKTWSYETTKTLKVGKYQDTNYKGYLSYGSLVIPSAWNIKKITITYKFGSSGAARIKTLYYYTDNNYSPIVGQVSAVMYNNTQTFEFSPTQYADIFNDLIAKYQSGEEVRIYHKEHNATVPSGGTYSANYLSITNSVLTIYYEDAAYIDYGIND